MSSFWVMLLSLPDIYKLIKTLEALAKEAETERKVKDDIKSIHEAFAAKDAQKLNDIFNN